jgi:preprotein translocase subunit SecF
MNDTVIVFDRVREFLDGKIRVLSWNCEQIN